MKYKGGTIERMDDLEASDFYPPKRYHVTLPSGKKDDHGATIVYTRNLKEAKEAIRDSH